MVTVFSERNYDLGYGEIWVYTIDRKTSAPDEAHVSVYSVSVRWNWSVAVKNLIFFLFVTGVLCLSLRGSTSLRGDGLEYIIQTQSIAHSAALAIGCPLLRDHFNSTNPYGYRISTTCIGENLRNGSIIAPIRKVDGNIGGLYVDRDGSNRFYHSFVYPLAISPLLWVVEALHAGPASEYNLFKVVNAALLTLPLVILRLRGGSLCGLGTFFLCTILSPLISYTSWTTPEVFSWALTATAFVVYQRPLIAAGLIGIVATQNPPAVLFLIPLLWRGGLPGATRGIALMCGVIISATIPAYFYWHFGVTSVIAATGQADLKYVSINRVADIWIHPVQRIVWYYPMVILAFLATWTVAQLRYRLLLLCAVIIAAAGAAATSNFHSAQVGAIRYGTWLAAPLAAEAALAAPSVSLARFLLSACVATLISVWTEVWRLSLKDERAVVAIPSFSQRLITATGYVGDIEPYVELVGHREIIEPWNFNWPLRVSLDGAGYWILPARALHSDKSTKLLSRLSQPADLGPLRHHPALGGYYLVSE